MIPGIALAEVFLRVVDKALGIYDHHLRTQYLREYREIIESLAEEEAKEIYPEDDVDPKLQRDQNKIDRLQLSLKILLERFLSEEGLKKLEK